jgi:hypothetical protein
MKKKDMCMHVLRALAAVLLGRRAEQEQQGEGHAEACVES